MSGTVYLRRAEPCGECGAMTHSLQMIAGLRLVCRPCWWKAQKA